MNITGGMTFTGGMIFAPPGGGGDARSFPSNAPDV